MLNEVISSTAHSLEHLEGDGVGDLDGARHVPGHVDHGDDGLHLLHLVPLKPLQSQLVLVCYTHTYTHTHTCTFTIMSFSRCFNPKRQ